MSNSNQLGGVFSRAQELLGNDPKLTAQVAAVLDSGGDFLGRDELWTQTTGLSRKDFDHFANQSVLIKTDQLSTLRQLAQTDQAAAIESYTALQTVLMKLADRINSPSAVATVRMILLAQQSIEGLSLGSAEFSGGSKKSSYEGQERLELQAEQLTKEAKTSTTPESSTPVTKSPDVATLGELLAELDSLTGLATVKAEVHKQAEVLRVVKLRTQRKMKNPNVSRHLVFTGNPGTGKTTVARLVAKIYQALGLLASGHLVEVDKSGLVAGYLGQTEEKTTEKIKEALGGVLFIDEAYSLDDDQYGEAAVNVLVKAVEDHRDDLVLIVAGYTEPMEQFIDSNPGLASRLRLTIFFPDYSDDELIEIFTNLAQKSDYTPTEDCVKALRFVLSVTLRDETFGNARFIRNCFEAALVRQAWRLRDIENPTDEDLRSLMESDIEPPTPLEPPVA